MDKQAFKQRMQNLKSYQENNPGKGYWDWKVEAFQEGGEVGNPSVQAIQQKEWLNNWLKNRSKQMAENIDFYSNQNRYGSSMDRVHVSPFFFQDKEENAAFTNDEKDFIINYLIDCLVEGQPFDCSSLGPNKYLNE